ncbi:MAG TPA: hypothetical protein DDX54_06955 [Rhodospirillaceae bacterium]|jgi:YD repeat-containing protein|nr:hypothetical protein [Alphaproteobacteria bacterium]HBH27121.1 hypothetical protein [Rhodospirillaceae bacterium]
MANKRITDLQAKTLPYAGGEVGVVDDGTTTYRADLRYWGLANAAMTYNPDGTMATLTKAGRTTTFTYTDGVLTGTSDGAVSRTFGYDGSGRMTSVTVS